MISHDINLNRSFSYGNGTLSATRRFIVDPAAMWRWHRVSAFASTVGNGWRLPKRCSPSQEGTGGRCFHGLYMIIYIHILFIVYIYLILNDANIGAVYIVLMLLLVFHLSFWSFFSIIPTVHIVVVNPDAVLFTNACIVQGLAEAAYWEPNWGPCSRC